MKAGSAILVAGLLLERSAASWIAAGDGAYDCAHASATNPCEDVAGYNILPLRPNCQQYMLCGNHNLAAMFSCGAGTVFDHRVKMCVSEELADCPCTVAIQPRSYLGSFPTENSGPGVSFRGYDAKTAKTADTTTSSKSGKQAKMTKGSSSKSGKQAKGGKTSKALFVDTSAEVVEETEETPSNSRCPPIYEDDREYAEDDIVSVEDPHDPGVYFVHQCKQSKCGDIIWDRWIITGVCDTHNSSGDAGGSSKNTPGAEPDTTEATPTTTQTGPTLATSTQDTSSVATIAQSCVSGSWTEDFESGIFPLLPWTTGGDGNWAIDEGDTYQGSYSIKSPDLSGMMWYPISNATITTCESFGGGTLTMGLKASVLPPNDVFVIYVDGSGGVQMMDINEWREVTVDIPPGRHVIDFSYQYNMFDLDALPHSSPGTEGAVYIDDLVLTEKVTLSSKLKQVKENWVEEFKQRESSDGAIHFLGLSWIYLGLCFASLLV